LTLMKLSAWLPVVALTLTTGSRQAIGVNSKSVGCSARSGGFMHFLVPSGTLIPSFAPNFWACKRDVTGVRSAKTVTRTVRRRRVFILMKWVRAD
jgi:hypothetical protein